MGCGTSTIKYLLFIFNLIFALGGLALVVIGSIIQWNLNHYNELFGESITVPSILLIIVGSAIFIISFFGCCGSIRESHCMIITYSILVLVIFIAQLTGGILALVFKEKIDAIIKKSMEDLQKNYGESGVDGELATQTWDFLQKEFKCCGVSTSADWLNTPYNKVPDSCKCESNLSESLLCMGGVYIRGCYTPFVDFIHTVETILGAVAIAIAVTELLGVIFACTLASAIKQKKSWNV